MSRSSSGFCVALALLLSLLTAAVAPGQTSTERVATGLSAPLFGTAPPGDTERLFLVELGSGSSANIKILDLATSQVLPTPFLTVSGIRTGGERGLLGLAFHPDYTNNGYFYVYASAPGGNANHRTQIRRYRAPGDPATAATADAGSEQLVLQFDQPFSNHNGGWIGFNPERFAGDNQYLYIASGDGGSHGDPTNNAQDITNNLLGKMLRIDVDSDQFVADPLRNYAIPPSNPFVGQTGDDEIWSYGLRNPFRASFDRETGDLWIGDVGQELWEEIDWQSAQSSGGENWGWRVMEGDACFDNGQVGGNPPCGAPHLAAPLHDYGHGFGPMLGDSVTGGYLYRGSIAQFEGLYFFADYESHNVWTLDPYAVNVSDSVLRRNEALTPNSGSLFSLASFAEDEAGELYLVSLGGNVFRIRSTAAQAVWDGSAAIGVPGDGSSWAAAANWSRGGAVDTGPVAADDLRFPASGGPQTILLGADRTVGGLVVEGDTTLQNHELRILSGNIHVANGVTATSHSSLVAETVATSLRKRGPGTLVVSGNSGQTVVLEGTLAGSGMLDHLTVWSGGTVAPGVGVGTLSVAGTYRQHVGGVLQIELNNGGHDQLTVADSATLAGQLGVTPLPGYSDPAARGAAEVFTLVVAGQRQGTFSSVSYGGTTLNATFTDPSGNFRSHQGDGLFRNLTYAATLVTLTNYLALSGDADGDGAVMGSTDGAILLAELGAPGPKTWTDADFTGDGQVTASQDGAQLLAALQLIPDSAAAGQQLVAPEPGQLWWVALALCSPLLYSARRRSQPASTRIR